MNIKQIQYAVMLYKMRSFSLVSEKLNISQPALSKQILNLEKELGTKLFDRNTIPLGVTEAGEFFIQKAEELLQKQDNLLDSMKHFTSKEKDKLIIGISPFRSLYIMPEILTQLREEFPETEIILAELGSDELREGEISEKYDFAILNLPVDESKFEITPLKPDKLVLAIPNKFAKYLPKDNGSLPEIDFSLCKDIPFVMVGKNQEMRKLCDKLCKISGFVPNIATQVVNITTAWTLTKNDIGATLVPYDFIKNEKSQNLSIYSIKERLYTRQPVIVYKKNRELSIAAKFAIKLLLEKF